MWYYVYLTTNNVNSKNYVGKHYGKLEDDYLGSGVLLNKAIDKYGRENFRRDIIAICGSEEISYILETEYITIYKAIGKAEYNLAIGGKGGQNGRKHTEIEKKKIAMASSEHWKREGYRENFSKKMKGKKRPKDVCEKIHNKLKGRCTNKHWYTDGNKNVCCEICPDGFYPGRIVSEESIEKQKKNHKIRVNWHHSNETKEKIRQKLKENPSRSMLGKHHSEETKRKMSEARKGRHLSEESKEKIRKFNLGRHHDEETKRKISKARKGRIMSKEIRSKISNSKKGHFTSEETKIKIANSMKKRWEEGCFLNRKIR